jgi:hypothetical protein
MSDWNRMTCPICAKPQSDRRCPNGRPEGAHVDNDSTDLLDFSNPGHALESLAAKVGPVPRILPPDVAGGGTESPLVNLSSAETREELVSGAGCSVGRRA